MKHLPTVLIIDDERVQASFYERALRRKGFDVEQVTDVDAGLARVKATCPDVIILDIMMPPGQAYAHAEHFEGLRTGVFLVRDLQALCPTAIIVVSTVVGNPETLQMVYSRLPRDQVTLKATCEPVQLADLVERLTQERDRKKSNG